MLEPGNPLTIIMVDDDAEDAMLTKAAIEASGQKVDFHHIGSGIDLFEKLKARLEESAVCSALILLDLNMPVMDGREGMNASVRCRSLSSAHLRQRATSIAVTQRVPTPSSPSRSPLTGWWKPWNR